MDTSCGESDLRSRVQFKCRVYKELVMFAPSDGLAIGGACYAVRNRKSIKAVGAGTLATRCMQFILHTRNVLQSKFKTTRSCEKCKVQFLMISRSELVQWWNGGKIQTELITFYYYRYLGRYTCGIVGESYQKRRPEYKLNKINRSFSKLNSVIYHNH